jgi:taurine dioxygenase
MNNKSDINYSKTDIGYKVDIKDVTNITSAEIDVIIKNVLTYGVCYIKKQKLTPQSLEGLTRQLGELITLPRHMTFDNNVNDCESVVRISNIGKDGNVIKNFTGAEYWHQDGDFNVGGKRRVWSFLYAEIVPSIGGSTGFCDGRRVLKTLPDDLLNFAKTHQIVINPEDIPDFKLYDIKHVKLPMVYHNIVEWIKKADEDALYLGSIGMSQIVGLDAAASEQMKTKIAEYLIREDNLYIHKWEPGDLVIWDNMLVYHRSMGGYGNEKRLLYRTQARMFQN